MIPEICCAMGVIMAGNRPRNMEVVICFSGKTSGSNGTIYEMDLLVICKQRMFQCQQNCGSCRYCRAMGHFVQVVQYIQIWICIATKFIKARQTRYISFPTNTVHISLGDSAPAFFLIAAIVMIWGVSFSIGVPPVIIHLRLGFPTKTIQLLGYPHGYGKLHV